MIGLELENKKLKDMLRKFSPFIFTKVDDVYEPLCLCCNATEHTDNCEFASLTEVKND